MRYLRYLTQFSELFIADRMSEKISLRRNDFQFKTSELFSALRLEKDFYDVTLVTDDDVQISAHKLILASSSGFFKSIFRKNIHPHPLVYLSEMDSKSLGLVLDYIYQGEAKMNQKQVDNFLKISRKLKIEDLMRLDQDEQGDEETEDFLQSNDIEDSRFIENIDEETDQINESEDSIEDGTTECLEEDKAKLWKQSIRDLFLVRNEEKKVTEDTSQGDREDKPRRLSYRESNIYYCENCKYFTKVRAHLLRHVESHVEGIKYECQFCDKTFQMSNNYQRHIGFHHPEQGNVKIQSALKLTERNIISAEPRENVRDKNVHQEEIFLVQELGDEKEMKKENSSELLKYSLKDKREIFYKKEGSYQCFYCGYFSSNKHHAFRHAEVHMEGLSYQCCGKNFKLTEVYTRHLRKNHPDISCGQLLQSKLKISESLQIFLSK